MGTGKTTIGRGLAQLLGWDFFDTDYEIEKAVGLRVEEIFRRFGEIRFRSEESLILQKIVVKPNCVISTGGGATLDPANYALLKENCYVVCLTATPETIHARTARQSRPLLRKDRSLNRIVELLQAREAAYRGADLYLDTSQATRDELIEDLRQWWMNQER